MKRAVGIVLLVALAGLIGWAVYRRVKQAGPQTRGPARSFAATVEVAAAVRGEVRDIGAFSGALVAKSEFPVSAKIGGRVRRMLVDLGDSVTNGQVVAYLDDEDLLQDVEQARAGLEVARANLDESTGNLHLARQEFMRASELKAGKIISDSEFETTRAQFEVQTARQKLAAATVEQKESVLSAARLRLSYAAVAAAWTEGGASRRVGRRYVSEGTLVRAGDPLVLLSDLDPLTAVFDVTEKEYMRIRTGQVVRIACASLPARAFEGTVRRMAPRFEELTRQARVEVLVANTDLLLKPGLFVQGAIEFARRDDAQLVPLKAIARRQGRAGVFVADAAGETAAFVPVELGIAQDDRVQVVAPVLTNRVVTVGHHLLEDGGRIQLPKAAPGPAGDGPARKGGPPGGNR